MITLDFAASFPHCAEEAQNNLKKHYSRLLPGNRKLNNGEIFIYSEPCDHLGRIGWEVRLSEGFQQEVAQYKNNLEQELSWAGKAALEAIRSADCSWGVSYYDPDSDWAGLAIRSPSTGSVNIGEVLKADLRILKKIS
jgi:hypothetical protein